MCVRERYVVIMLNDGVKWSCKVVVKVSEYTKEREREREREREGRVEQEKDTDEYKQQINSYQRDPS